MNQGSNKGVFLDKDGTIVDNSGYPEIVPTDKLLVNEVVEGLRYLQNKGYKLFIISNQSWIAKGRLSLQQVEEVFQNVVKQLQRYGIFITAYFYCPHLKSDNCECRKPKSKFIDQAVGEYALDLQKCIFIGDMEADIAAGKNRNLTTVLVQTGAGKNYKSTIKPDFVIKNINNIKEVM